MKMILAFIAFICFVCSPIAFAQTPGYDAAAAFVCASALGHKDYTYADHFSPRIVEKLPETAFRKAMSDLTDTLGFCASFQQSEFLPKGVRYNFISASKDSVTLDMTLNDAGLIDGLMVHGVSLPSHIIKNWADVEARASMLEGEFSVSIQSEISQPHAHLGNTIHPVGSAFKLYVLGALVDDVQSGAKKWNQTFPITQDWKSLPSGIMQDWEAGKMVSLQEYAEWMIKISDNTAADHLIHILGRDKVEAQLSILGNSAIARNQPLLLTSDMFRLKWAAPPSLTQEYLSADLPKKRELLKTKIAPIPLSKYGTNGVATEIPTLINELEWFASTNDLCNAMAMLNAKNSPQALDILSKNVPFISTAPGSKWAYVGYKGGSEPGVMTMSFLLRSKTGNAGCVAVSWHNTKKEINSFIMMDLVEKILRVSESYF